MEKLGGPQELLAAWIDQVERLRKEPSTTKKLMDFYRTLVRMVEVCDGLKTDACELNDDALSGQLLENT